MKQFHIDWRWIALIVFMVILANERNLPWPVTMLALASGGSYLCYLAWQHVGGKNILHLGRQSTHTTYWRGQRIEMPNNRTRSRGFSWRENISAIVYALLGGTLVVAALSILFEQIAR